MQLELQKHEENCFISDEKFVCDLCSKEFVSQRILQAHRRTHTNPKKRKAEVNTTFKEPKMKNKKLDEIEIKAPKIEIMDFAEPQIEITKEPQVEIKEKTQIKIKKEINLNCEKCNFIANSEIGLIGHNTVKHPENTREILWFVRLTKLKIIVK